MFEDSKETERAVLQIREEMRTATTPERVRELEEEYARLVHRWMQVDSPAEMADRVKDYLRRSEDRYPALMDAADGSHEVAAGPVLGLMMLYAADGREIGIGEAADIVEHVSAEVVTGLDKDIDEGFRVPGPRFHR